MTPAERSLRGRIGAFSLHAMGKTDTRAARAAFMGRFEKEVDPEGVLPEPERLRRAELAKRAYFSKLALRRVQNKARRG